MEHKTLSLEQITSNVFKKIFSKKVCLPSDYLLAFNEESKEIDSIDDIVSEEIKKDYARAQDIMKRSITSLEKSKEILTKSVEVIASENREEILKMTSNMNNMLAYISSLTNELHTDELTKAYNRKWLFNEYMKDTELLKEKGVLVFIDLNDFKKINDTYGHYTGDKVLAYFVTFLNTEFKTNINLKYYVIRFAGDEFLILFKEEEKIVKDILRKAKDNLSKKTLKFQNKDENFKINFSYGISSFKAGDNIHDVMKKSDENMYEMKKSK